MRMIHATLPRHLPRTVLILSLLLLGILRSASAETALPVQAAKSSFDPSKIKHIIFMVQENHTFDSYFGRFPGTLGATMGKISTGATIPLSDAPDIPENFLHTWDVAHTDHDNGNMDGFNIGSTSPACNTPSYPCYIAAQQSLIPNYWALADRFILDDMGFSSVMGPSFPNHLYTVAAAAGPTLDQSAINNPNNSKNPPGQEKTWGCDATDDTTVELYPGYARGGTSGYPCFGCPKTPKLNCLPHLTNLADLLAAKGKTWKYYAGDTFDNALDAFYQDYKSPNIIKKDATTAFDTDAKNGNLPDFSWLVAPNADNEHPGQSSSCAGENWAYDRIKAVENSKDWDSSVIVETWDDFGGLYDHVPPLQVDKLGLGFRVPFLIMSPFGSASGRNISHVPLEFSSVLKFAEQVFDLGVGSLHGRDADPSTNSIAAVLDTSKTTDKLILTGHCIPILQTGTATTYFLAPSIALSKDDTLAIVNDTNIDETITGTPGGDLKISKKGGRGITGKFASTGATTLACVPNCTGKNKTLTVNVT